MSRPKNGRAIFLHRDSLGKSETAPAEYIKWAQKEAKRLDLQFTGTPNQINEMIAQGISCKGDIFLDYGVRGHKLDRLGLNGLIQEIERDNTISHVLIPLRDRIARPKMPEFGVQIESRICTMGVTIVFMDKTVPPIGIGQQPRLEDSLTGTFEYYQAGKFSRDLSRKLTLAKRYLAEHGHSAGGMAAYGFERWLVGPDNKPVRLLAHGERTKLPGHHVRHLPTNLAELEVVKRIKDLVPKKSLTKIAELLTAEGVKPPCKSRRNTSGVWNAKTVRNIATNPIYIGVLEYGKTSSGEYYRFTKDGPRELLVTDIDQHGNPRVVQNNSESLIRTQLEFEPIFTQAEFDRNRQILQSGDKSQKRKRREQGGNCNPLGARIFDAFCGWPMYRQQSKSNYCYVCGLYKQTDGKCCERNRVQAVQMVPFLLNCIRQRILSPPMLSKIQERVQALIEAEYGVKKRDNHRKTLEANLKKARSEVKQAGRNLALLNDADQIEAVKAVFDEMQMRVRQLETQIATPPTPERATIEAEVSQALSRLNQLNELAAMPQHLDAIDGLFSELNVRVFCRFVESQTKGRTCNKLLGGMITFGSRPAPVKTYQGPTGRGIIKNILMKGDRRSLYASDVADHMQQQPQGSERGSLRNLNWRTPRAVVRLRGL